MGRWNVHCRQIRNPACWVLTDGNGSPGDSFDNVTGPHITQFEYAHCRCRRTWARIRNSQHLVWRKVRPLVPGGFHRTQVNIRRREQRITAGTMYARHSDFIYQKCVSRLEDSLHRFGMSPAEERKCHPSVRIQHDRRQRIEVVRNLLLFYADRACPRSRPVRISIKEIGDGRDVADRGITDASVQSALSASDQSRAASRRTRQLRGERSHVGCHSAGDLDGSNHHRRHEGCVADVIGSDQSHRWAVRVSTPEQACALGKHYSDQRAQHHKGQRRTGQDEHSIRPWVRRVRRIGINPPRVGIRRRQCGPDSQMTS